MDAPKSPDLLANVPLRELVLPFKRQPISLLVLQDAIAFQNSQHAKGDNNEVYWGELWPAAIALADAILDGEVWLPPGPQAVLELGCGAGLPAIAAAIKGTPETHVLASDLEPFALALTLRNAERNGVKDRVGELVFDWRDPYPRKHRLIIISDCLYDPDADGQITAFLRRGLDDDPRAEARAVIVDPDRWAARNFVYRAQEAGFRVRTFRREVPFINELGPLTVLPQTGPPTDREFKGNDPIEVNFYELQFR